MQRVKTIFTKLAYDPKTLQQKNLLGGITTLEECNTTKVLELFKTAPETDVSLSPGLYKDIEFWNNVFPRINKCVLLGGTCLSHNLFESPLANVAALERRKSVLRALEFSDEDKEKLKSLKSLETTVLWTFQELQENIEDLYDLVYFKFFLLRRFNNIPEVLTANNIYRILVSPLIGLLSPIVYFLIPYLIVVYKFGIKMSFVSYLKLTFKTMLNSDFMMFGGMKYKTVSTISYFFSLLFYFQGLFNSFELSRSLYKVSKHLTEKINIITEFLKTSTELVSKHWQEDMAIVFGLSDLKSLDEEMQYINGLVSKPFTLLSNFGRQLHAYKFLDKNIIKSILTKVYTLDVFNGLREFKNEYNYGFAEFVEKETPFVKLNGLRHPVLDNAKCISNSIVLGGDKPNNAIITGTNAGGKSVTIKGILINALLSQTCTISCCDDAITTPFVHLNSQIQMPDCTGYESLFEAEMHRCKGNLDKLKELDGHSLIVMDEIFSSTNPVEAISGAYAVCKKIASYDRNILLFTTHFNYLTNLKRTGKFVNYKMETLVDGSEYKFTYRLVRGVNKHFLALEILKHNGFDEDIIDEALEIKKKFV